MSLEIGNKKLIHSESVLVPENEDVWIEFRAYQWDIKLNFQFDNENEEKSDGQWDFEGVNDHAVATLYNWNDPAGMVLPTFYEVGTTEGKSVYMMFFCQGIGPVTKFEVQFYIEVENHE